MYLRDFVFRRKRLLIILIVLVLCWIALLNSELSPDFYFLHVRPLDDISCYDSNEGDVLESAEQNRFSPTENSIFFHETSCKGGLNSRQACAVEAAARSHPHRSIYVLFLAPVTEILAGMKVLRDLVLPNIHFARVHVRDYARGTPLEEFVISGRLNQSRWRISHTSDVLRYLTLYKWGGVYLDMDTVVVQPFDTLEKNWGARESDEFVAAGAMSFTGDPIGKKFAMDAINDIAKNFRGDVWGHNGPGVVTRVLKEWCNTDDVTNMSLSSCQGFEVYGPELFYPIPWQNATSYFEPGELDMEGVYMYHVWNGLTKDMKVLPNSRYQNLAKTYCPSIYEFYKDDFGT